MAQSSEEITSPPDLLNSLEFPSLPAHTCAETNITEIHSSTLVMTKTINPRGQATKRPVTLDEDSLTTDEMLLLSSMNSGSSDSGSSVSPRKKSRRLDYREPPPILQSLDSDAFKNLFESPNLSESQNSDVGLGSLATSPNQISSNNNLPSIGIGDIIQKYGNATLDSLKGFEIPLDESDNAQSSPRLLSPVSRRKESFGMQVTMPSFVHKRASSSSTSHTSSIDSISESSEMVSPVVVSPVESTQDDNGTEIQQTNLMSIGPDITCSTSLALQTDQNTSAYLNVADQPSEPESFEELLSSGGENLGNQLKDSEREAQVIVHNSKTESTAKEKTPDEKDGSNPEGNEEDEEEDDASEEEEDNEDSSDESSENAEDFETGILEAKTCKKNPGHSAFHSLSDLKVKDLPPEIQHEDSLTFLNCAAQLVVQITVGSTSAARGPNDMYRHYIGTNRKRNGSGFIASVDDDIKRFRCRRDNCPHAEEGNSSFEDSADVSSPGLKRNLSNMSTASTSSSSSGRKGFGHYIYSGVNVRTNKHVIFDKSEADSAYVKFFYNTPDGKGVIHGHVAAIIGVNNSQDHVILHVMSHDKTLFNALGLCLQNARSSYNQMLTSTHKTHQIHGEKYKHSWVAVISHPHGLAKSVTIGRVKKEEMDGIRILKYYDAATCPGSSGGLVITPSLLKLQWPGAVHSCTDRNSGLNVTFDSRVQDLNIKDISRIHRSMINRKESYSDNFFKL